VANLVSLLEPRLIGLWQVTGLTLSQRRVLWRLRDDRMSAGDLADVLGLSPPSLTRLLTKLEDRGLLVRILDRTDRRRILVELSPEGRRALTNYRMFAGSSLSRAARALAPAEQREVAGAIALLVRLAREIEEREPGD
jgi:DNA-binding MarR family transcriptional regulator